MIREATNGARPRPCRFRSAAGPSRNIAGCCFISAANARDDDKTLKDVQAYDPKTDRWRLLAPIPVERHAQAAAVAGDKVYMIGGSTGCGAEDLLADNLVFTLP
jgi:hypothetical protein